MTDIDAIIPQSVNTLYTDQLHTALSKQYTLHCSSDAELQQLLQQMQHDYQSNKLLLPKLATPTLRLDVSQCTQTLLRTVQYYLQQFEYNHIGAEHTVVDKSLNYAQLCKLTQLIISKSLPIKCLEAVCIAQYVLRNSALLRIPLRFKSVCNGVEYWHIVLLVYDRASKCYGTVGVSRRTTLAYYACTHSTASAVVQQFVAAYEQIGHTVCSITLGLPFQCKTTSAEPVYWKLLNLSNCTVDSTLYTVIDECCSCVEQLAVVIRTRNTCKLNTALSQHCKIVKVDGRFQIVVK